MKCRVCGKEIEEGSEFCRYCGASQKKKRKPTWSERKRAREKETAEILRKSYITEQDALLAVPTGTEGLEVRLVGDTHGEFKKCVALSVLYGLLTAAALAGLVFFQRNDEVCARSKKSQLRQSSLYNKRRQALSAYLQRKVQDLRHEYAYRRIRRQTFRSVRRRQDSYLRAVH